MKITKKQKQKELIEGVFRCIYMAIKQGSDIKLVLKNYSKLLIKYLIT